MVNVHIEKAKGTYKLNLTERTIAGLFIGVFFAIYFGIAVLVIAAAIWAVEKVMQ